MEIVQSLGKLFLPSGARENCPESRKIVRINEKSLGQIQIQGTRGKLFRTDKVSGIAERHSVNYLEVFS